MILYVSKQKRKQEREHWKYKQAHQAIHTKESKLRWFHRQKDCDHTEENKQKT